MTTLNTKLLAIYLQDQLAAAAVTVSLCGRIAGSHRGTALGDTVEALTLEVTTDRQVLVDLMATLGVSPDRVKLTAAYVGERLGRLKLNGSLVHRSPLSDVIELDGLRALVELKAAGWRLLRALSDLEPKLAAVDLVDLLQRADDQARRIEELRLSTAQDRLAS